MSLLIRVLRPLASGFHTLYLSSATQPISAVRFGNSPLACEGFLCIVASSNNGMLPPKALDLRPPDCQQASNPTDGTVASRIQVFQAAESLRSPKLAGQCQKPIPSNAFEVTTGQMRRANTTFASSTFLSPRDRDTGIQNGGRLSTDVSLCQPIKGSPAKKQDVTLPARPSTSFDSFIPHQPLKASNSSQQNPERRNMQRRQSSLDANSTTQHRLSGARARLKSIGEEKTGTPPGAVKAMDVSPSRQKAAIHELQNLIDDAIGEQSKLDTTTASTKRSRLQPIASQIELNMTNPTERQSIEAEASASPSRRAQSVRNPSRRRESETGPTDLDAKDCDSALLPSTQQISSRRKQRWSTDSVLPRSSINSEQLPIVPHSSIHSTPEVKAGPDILQLHPHPPGSIGRSPVKQRAAAFEKMMQHDKQIMYNESHKHNGKIHVKKHWLLDSSDNDEAGRFGGNVKHESASATTRTGQTVRHNPPTSTRSIAPVSKSGPIPLALPQLISSRGRAVSASSQFEEGFETAPESEAALSRLSSRIHSPRTMPKMSGAHEVGNETKSPFFRWKPFMSDKASSANKTFPASSMVSSLGANVGRGLPEPAIDALARQELVRAKDQSQGARHERPWKQEYAQNTLMSAAQVKGVSNGPAPCSVTQESRIFDGPIQLTPKRLSLRSHSRNQDHISTDGAANGATPKQAGSTGMYSGVASTENSCSSSDITVDDGKEVALTQTDLDADDYDEKTTEIEIQAYSSQLQTKDATPFPLMAVKASNTTSGAGSPIRGRAAARSSHRQSTVMRHEGNGDYVRVSRSRSKTGNVRVTVEVRTPQGSPVKDDGDKEGGKDWDVAGNGGRKGDRVVIVTTDVQQQDEEKSQ